MLAELIAEVDTQADAQIADLIDVLIDRMYQPVPIVSQSCPHCALKRDYLIAKRRLHFIRTLPAYIPAYPSLSETRINVLRLRHDYHQRSCLCGNSHLVTWESCIKLRYH